MQERMRFVDIKKNQKAGLFIRFVALFIDILIISVLELLYFEVLFSLNSLEDYTKFLFFYIIFTLWGIMIYLLYVALFTSNFGGTIGKLATGLRVVDDHGNYLSDKRSIFRHTIGYFVSTIMLGFGYLYIHDRTSHTEVYLVDKRMQKIGVIVLMILCVFSLFLTKEVVVLFDKNEVLRQNRTKQNVNLEEQNYPGPFLRED